MQMLPRPRRSAVMLLPVLALVIASGCTPWATYPPIEGAMGISNPQLTPLPDLMSDAIWFTYQSYEDGGPIAINLPPGTQPRVYDMVVDRLGGPETAFPMSTDDQRAYTVTEVRVRTVDAAVDLVHPLPDGSYAESTIEFKQNLLKGWYPLRAKRWRYAVQKPVSNYVGYDQWAEASTGADDAP